MSAARSGPPTPRRAAIALAWLLGLALVALHLGAWRPPLSEAGLGWLPAELSWRLLWMGLAWLYLLGFTAAVWRGGARDGAAGEERE